MSKKIIKKCSKVKELDNWDEISKLLKLSGMANAMVKHARVDFRNLNNTLFITLTLICGPDAEIEAGYYDEILEELQDKLKKNIILKIYYKDGSELWRLEQLNAEELAIKSIWDTALLMETKRVWKEGLGWAPQKGTSGQKTE